MTDMPPAERFSGLRSGFLREMARSAAGSEFPIGIRLQPDQRGVRLKADTTYNFFSTLLA